ncbi:hypothetical protein MTBBW1_210005 [Desulfamplus magnetovallimortis]|uniref:Uncharacterized protein n=1 Tax=Desulfamplus magnetovallimortis TaxID=1246637 RepID=A0A1W1HCD5_9BACT|nr:hypothetical protein MTBBW1_210005 [Desulfamplus magnetovallimortis]
MTDKIEPDPIRRKDNEAVESSNELQELKQEILKKLSAKFPEKYADDIEFTENFFENDFYTRKCMEDIFNQDKLILLGSKGTGKTAFYQALRQDNFFKKLCSKAQKKHINYQIVNIITIEGEKRKQHSKFFDVAGNISKSDIDDPEFFYSRFWRVYIWNALRLDDEKIGFVSQIKVSPIKNNGATADFFKHYINNDDNFLIVENELDEIDKHLKSKDQNLIIIFDQLDKVIKPRWWSEAISPLIKFCQSRNYDRIHPKLFLRRDLFNKLGNLTNKASLEKQSINLEWTREELYAFFFKLVFSRCRKSFVEYAEKGERIKIHQLQDILKRVDKKNSYNQLPADEYLLKPLVNIFFGEHTGRFGETYDWIHKNLKNADGTISLRPFLDLVRLAMDKQYEMPHLNKDPFPVLSNKCLMNTEVREKAVEGHFKDLAGEEGNEILYLIINDIRDNKIPDKLKISPLTQHEFEDLMKDILSRNNQDLKDISVRDLEETLILNGIMFTKYIRGGKKQYTFAYLYKYYLGLRHPSKR